MLKSEEEEATHTHRLAWGMYWYMRCHFARPPGVFCRKVSVAYNTLCVTRRVLGMCAAAAV